MADLDDAVKLITDPSNATRMGQTGPEERFAVNQNRVMRALRDAGAGKAEARELALKALEKVQGGAEVHASRGAPAVRGARGRDRGALVGSEERGPVRRVTCARWNAEGVRALPAVYRQESHLTSALKRAHLRPSREAPTGIEPV